MGGGEGYAGRAWDERNAWDESIHEYTYIYIFGRPLDDQKDTDSKVNLPKRTNNLI